MLPAMSVSGRRSVSEEGMHCSTFGHLNDALLSNAFAFVCDGSMLSILSDGDARGGFSLVVAAGAGGRGVIEGLGKQLNLDRRQVEPSFNSLYWWVQRLLLTHLQR